MEDICSTNLAKALEGEGIEQYVKDEFGDVAELRKELDEMTDAGSKRIKIRLKQKKIANLEKVMARHKNALHRTNQAYEVSLKLSSRMKQNHNKKKPYKAKDVINGIKNIFINNFDNTNTLENLHNIEEATRNNVFVNLLNNPEFLGKADAKRTMKLFRDVSGDQEVELRRLVKQYDADPAGTHEGSTPEMTALAKAVTFMNIKNLGDLKRAGVLVDKKSGLVVGQTVLGQTVQTKKGQEAFMAFFRNADETGAIDWKRMQKNGHFPPPKNLDTPVKLQEAKEAFFNGYLKQHATFDTDIGGDITDIKAKHKRRSLDFVDGHEDIEVEFAERFGLGSFGSSFITGLNQASRNIANSNFMGDLKFLNEVVSNITEDVSAKPSDYGVSPFQAEKIIDEIKKDMNSDRGVLPTSMMASAGLDTPVGHGWFNDVGKLLTNLETTALLGGSLFSSIVDTVNSSSVLSSLTKRFNVLEYGVDTLRPMARFFDQGNKNKLSKALAQEQLEPALEFLKQVKIQGQKASLAGGEGSVLNKMQRQTAIWGGEALGAFQMDRWNAIGKNIFTAEFSTRLGGHLKSSYADLPPHIKSVLGQGDISSAEWDAIGSVATKNEILGKTFLSGKQVEGIPNKVIDELYSPGNEVALRKAKSALANKVDAMLFGLRDVAVLEPGAELRALKQRWGGKVGTGWRQTVDNTFFLRGFPVAWVQKIPTMLARSAELKGGGAGGILQAYAPHLTASMTIAFGAITPLKRMFRGENPYPDTNDPEDVKRYMLEGAIYSGWGGIGSDMIANVVSIISKPGAGWKDVSSALTEFIGGPGIVLPAKASYEFSVMVAQIAKGDLKGRQAVKAIHAFRKFIPFNNYALTRAITDSMMRAVYASIDPAHGWYYEDGKLTQAIKDKVGM